MKQASLHLTRIAEPQPAPSRSRRRLRRSLILQPATCACVRCRYNTAEDAKVVSWWDYGYQTTAMANRTVLVDNNTWNNTHIATVGRAMASTEKRAYKIYRELDVDYVLVVFGGFLGYPSDDINKFLWMVRIAAGEFPDIQERNYLGSQGYKVDSTAPRAMLDSLMYKLSYYGCALAGAHAHLRNSMLWSSVLHCAAFRKV